MSAPENPLAFPNPMIPEWSEGSPGMSLRDWFAGQAAIAFAKYGPNGHASAELIAGASYELADAMLAERTK